MKTPLLFLFLLLTSASFLYGQTGSIQGVVKDQLGPLPGATVLVNDSGIGEVTDLDGRFFLSRVPVGSQTLTISFLGFASQEIEVMVTENALATTADVILKEEGEILDLGVEVTATMKNGEARAINMIKTSDRIVNIVAAAGIGKLPDKNAADALQRIPAIAVEKDQGEGRHVSVRGTPRDWSSSLINGDRMPVADEDGDSRSLAFDIFPSELIEYIVVSKALTPDLEADAIGGSINFITKAAPESRVLNAKTGGGYNLQSQGPAVDLSLTYGDRVANGRFGYLLSGSLFRRSWGTDNFEVTYGGNYDHGIARFELRDYIGTRQTIGLNASAEYKVSDRVKVYGKAIHGRFDDDEFNRKTMFFYRLGTGDQVELQNIHNKLQMRFYGGEFGSEMRIGNRVKLNVRVASYSNSFGYGPVPNTERDSVHGYHVVRFQLRRPTEFLDMVYTENGSLIKLIGDDQIGNFEQQLDSLPDFFNPGEFIYFTTPDLESSTGPGDDFNNIQPQYIQDIQPEDFEFFGAYSELNNTTERDPIVAQADLEIEATNHFTVKVGSKFRAKDGERRIGLHKWSLINTQGNSDPILLTDLPIAPLNTHGGFLEELGSNYEDSFFPFLQEEVTDNFVIDNADRLIENRAITEEEAIANSGGTYSYTENVLAGYVMGNWQVSDKFSVIGGLRAEYTDLDMVGDTVIVMTDALGSVISVEQSEAGNDYLSFFPSLHLRFSPKPNMNIRLSGSRSMRRPNFNEARPGSPSIEFTNIIYEFGNPDLQPSFSWNGDVSFEYFFRNAGLLSVSGFYKYITDHIFATNIPFNPQSFNVPTRVNRSYENADNSFVLGLEVVANKQFDFLPGFLSGFGINGNYTYIHSEMNVPGRIEPQPLPRQASHLFNAALFYEKGFLTSRLALNYRGEYLYEINSFQEAGSDRWLHQDTEYDLFLGALTTLDFSSTFRINKNWSVYVEVNNLLNQPFRIYRGIEEHPVQTEYYSLRGQAGVKFQLN